MNIKTSFRTFGAFVLVAMELEHPLWNIYIWWITWEK